MEVVLEYVSKLDLASVRAITDETAGVATDTGNKVKIKRIYRFIVKNYCKNCKNPEK